MSANLLTEEALLRAVNESIAELSELDGVASRRFVDPYAAAFILRRLLSRASRDVNTLSQLARAGATLASLEHFLATSPELRK